MSDRINIGKPGDFHVHLREGAMMDLVTPTIRDGGVSIVFVMPNLVPPLIDVDRVLAYKKQLETLSPSTTFLMSLYLRPEITPEVIEQAAKAGITGVKCYPAGVTTNSSHGVSSYEPYYPTFAAMEKHDLILNLHGECPSSHSSDISVMNAEHKFLPTLKLLHAKFPKLRIILEHCTSADAIEAVKECGPTVAATITAHHLFLTVDSWGGNALNFCKPVAKLPSDKQALIDAATSGNPKFFFGSDSAPHPIEAKRKESGAAAGVFTQPYAIQYLAQVFDEQNKLDKLKAFVNDFGRKFYKKPEEDDKEKKTVVLVRNKTKVQDYIQTSDEKVQVVPFLAGQELDWTVEWE